MATEGRFLFGGFASLFSAAVRKLPRQKRGLGAAQGRFGYFVARDKVTRAGARNSPSPTAKSFYFSPRARRARRKQVIAIALDEELLSRQMPHSLEAEQAALGAMLIDADCIKDVMDKLQPEDFYVKQNRDVFETI